MSVGGNTAPQIAKDLGDRAFFFVFGDNVQAAAMAEYACEQGYKNAWLIASEEIPYTKDMPRYFKETFEQCGGAIAGEDVYKIGQTEFRTQVTKIQNADPAPDVIFSPMFVPDSGIFLKALRGAGVETPVPRHRRQRLDAVRRLGRRRRRRRDLLDARLRRRGRDRGLPGRLRAGHRRRGRVRRPSRPSAATTSTRWSRRSRRPAARWSRTT